MGSVRIVRVHLYVLRGSVSIVGSVSVVRVCTYCEGLRVCTYCEGLYVLRRSVRIARVCKYCGVCKYCESLYVL